MKMKALLQQRMKKSSDVSKMKAMAKESAAGNLSSFSGLFNVSELTNQEKESISQILKSYSKEDVDISSDLHVLISLTSEVKAINNQAALLHGERIKKAHDVFTKYRDGAFTAWLIITYGNRQTPYNLMQYFEFCEALPKYRAKIELMPRQAVYTLATRMGSLEKKQEIVENYNGESKTEMLQLIRKAFPIDKEDKRNNKTGASLIRELEGFRKRMEIHLEVLNYDQIKRARYLLKQLDNLLAK